MNEEDEMNNNLNNEIEKELTTFSGTTFSSSEEVHKWLKRAFTRIAEKTVEVETAKAFYKELENKIKEVENNEQ
jgi:tRNA C32,U32 (ribose-2'-O)-methylase TrmJ